MLIRFQLAQQGHLTVAQSTTSRRYGDFFLRHSQKFADVYDNLRAKPLPLPKGNNAKTGGAAASQANGVPSQVASGNKPTGGSSAKGAWATTARA